MERVKGFAIDLKQSVFENETEAIMYVLKDVLGAETEFVFSIPVFHFTVSIKESNFKREIKQCLEQESMFKDTQKERLEQEMVRIIENWDEYPN